MAILVKLTWHAPDPDTTYNQTLIYRAASKYGTYSLAATLTNIRTSKYIDTAGTSSSWYKIRFYDSTNAIYSDYSAPISATGTIGDVNYATPKDVATHANAYRTYTAESLGTGDATTKTFGPVTDYKMIQDTEKVYVAAVEKIRNVDYTVDYDTGKVTFTTAPANLAALTIDYWASVYCINSRVIDAINRAEDEVNRRLRRTFYQPQTVTEYVDSFDPIDTSPFTFEATSYTSATQDYKAQMNEALYSRLLKLTYYPLTTLSQVIINAQPTTVTTEAVGTGAGVVTDFTLDYAPVVYGSEIVYVAGAQVTNYTMNYSTGVITFDTAPTGAITCDYIHCTGGEVIAASNYLTRLDSGQVLLKTTAAQIKHYPFVCAVTYTYGYTSVPAVVEHITTMSAVIEILISNVLGAPTAQDIDRNNVRMLRQEVEGLYDTLGRVMEVTRI